MSDQLREGVGAGSVAVRGADAGDGRSITGYAVRWGEYTDPGTTAEYGTAREGFDRGSFAAAIRARGDRPFPFLNRHRSRGGTVVGGITFTEDDIGLRFDGRLIDTPAAREYAAEAAVADGVSLELIPGDVRRPDARTVIHTAVRRLAGLAGEYVPAYATASVAVRGVEGSPVSDESKCGTCGAELKLGIAHECRESDKPAPTGQAPQAPAQPDGAERGAAFAGPLQLGPEARQLIEDSVRALAERSAGGLHAAPDKFAAFRQYATFGELMQAAGRPGAPQELRSYAALAIAQRALDDTVSTAGANAALLTGNLTVREIAGIVSRGRPAITAFGGPAPIPSVGLNVTWPYFDGTLTDFVGAQSAQKAEITSASLDIKLGTEALVTYAGGSDVALQLIRQGDPSVLDALGRVILTAWGVVTDAAFVTELESGSVTKDFAEALSAVDFAELVGHVVDTSITVETATGQPAEFILASSTAFAHFAKLIIAQTNTLVSGPSVDLAALDVRLGGLRLIHVPSITAGKAIMSNRLAARWHEAGPFQTAADDVAKIGRNIAYWSMGAGARYIPAGIVEMYDVTP